MQAGGGRGGIARNTIYNLAGSILPIAVTLVTVPLYLRQIGEARYGLLAIVWLILGYFSIFDMGLSRATANLTAKLRDGSADERKNLFWTAFCMNAGFGAGAGLLCWIIGGFLLEHVISMPPELREEVGAALPWVAFAVPLLTVGGAMTGTLEGNGRFLTLNLVSLTGATMFAVVPLMVALYWSKSLALLIPVAVLTRLTFAAPLVFFALRTLPPPRWKRPNLARGRQLLRYGSWVMVTNLVGPILEALDRLLIAAVLGVAAVTSYTIPFNLASRLKIIPQALGRTLFPHLSALDGEDARRTAVKSVRILGKIMTLVICVAVVGIQPFVALWISPGFAAKAAPIGEIILLGLWINALAFLPFSLLQAQGRPDLTAKFHAAELVPFVGVLWLGMHWFGLIGAAAAWSLRVVIDAALLFWTTRILAPAWRNLWPAVFAVAASYVLALALPDFAPLRWILGASVVGLVAFWTWQTEPGLRAKLLSRLPPFALGSKKLGGGAP